MVIQYRIKDNHDDWKKVRAQVFVDEQGFKNEFSNEDYNAMHLTMYVDGNLIGTCRAFIRDNVGIIGRLAVFPEYRRQGYGKRLIQKMEELLKSYNIEHFKLSAQVHAVPFYTELGYQKVGKPAFDEHVEHQMMEKHVKINEKSGEL